MAGTSSRKRVDSTGPRKSQAGTPNGTNGSNGSTPNGSHAAKPAKGIVVRKHTRPYGEFAGNIGCFCWTIYIPLQIYYFYGMAIMGKGELLIPDQKFWYDLTFGLPEGLAIRPTWWAMGFIGIYWTTQAVLELMLPSCFPFGFGVREGVTLKNGNKLKYPMNGLFSFFLCHGIYAALVHYGYLEAYFIFKQFGALLTGGVITAFVYATWLYVDFGLLWESHANDPEFEEDWGVFHTTDFWNDWFMGIVRNPRIGHRFFSVPLDLKRLWNGRTLTLWALLNFSYIAAQYYGCTFDYKLDGPITGAVCKQNGDWSNVGYASWGIALAQWYYVFDYNWCEPAYLTTTDIRHDLFGFMLTYGMFGFLVWFYPLCFLGYLSSQGNSSGGFITDNHVCTAIGVGLYLFGMFMFRYTNIEKHHFRTFISNKKAKGMSNFEVELELKNYKIWGKPVDYIRTIEGSWLLCSGTWGLARHFNYIGDLVMCIGWAVACYSPKNAFPWLPISYCAYFWVMDIHRCWRDDQRCSIKYKKDWENYCSKVKWKIFPGIY